MGARAQTPAKHTHHWRHPRTRHGEQGVGEREKRAPAAACPSLSTATAASAQRRRGRDGDGGHGHRLRRMGRLRHFVSRSQCAPRTSADESAAPRKRAQRGGRVSAPPLAAPARDVTKGCSRGRGLGAAPHVTRSAQATCARAARARAVALFADAAVDGRKMRAVEQNSPAASSAASVLCFRWRSEARLVGDRSVRHDACASVYQSNRCFGTKWCAVTL